MSILRKILFPISLVYGLVVYLRNRLYDSGILKSKTYQTPIICVGNLNVGGTGKTPMVELLISILQVDYKVAVLSRGYKRKSKGFIIASDKSTAEQLGDEPFQIHSKFSKVIVAVDADRQNGIATLEQSVKPDVILLDDAFQHRRVKPGFSILLTAFDNLYVDDWYLPTGNLRDGRREVQRADVVIVTKNLPDMTEEDRLKIEHKLKQKSSIKTLFSYLSYETNLLGSGSLLRMDDLKNKKITLVTGIANPTPLVNFLNKKDVLFEHLSFKDHHFFTKKELDILNKKEKVLTTEKDYMRLGNALKNCNYITVKHAFFNEGMEHLQSELKNFMNRYPPSSY